jgi:hypothetical protein
MAKITVLFLCVLSSVWNATAQPCDKLAEKTAQGLMSITIPAYIHKAYVCPDDTLLLYVAQDMEKVYLGCMPRECRDYVCEREIRMSYYEVGFADGSTMRHNEPYLTNYSVDDLFVLLQGQVRARSFNGRKKKTKYSDAFADERLIDKLANTPVKYIQAYHAIPRSNWDEDNKYKLEYKPGDKLELSPDNAQRLTLVIRCLRKDAILY